MKRKVIAIILIIMFAMTGCARIQIKDDVAKTALEVSAFTLGYLGAQRYPVQFGTAELVASAMLDEEGPLQGIIDALVKEIGVVIEDPLLKYQGEKLLSCLELQFEDGTLLVGEQGEIVKIALNEFLAGIRAAQGQADIEAFRVDLRKSLRANREVFDRIHSMPICKSRMHIGEQYDL